jgi:dihydrofolate synthase/folylpolyglutamate synthase
MKPGLERMQQLLQLADAKTPPFEVVLIAGTNGKGSTASMLAAILSASGKRTGLFTSPHLTYFNERFLVNGVPVAMPEVLARLEALIPLFEQTDATFFECVTLLGVKLFQTQAVETAVIEVGMGGRLDATNALAPKRTIITSVAYDHMAILGDTLEQIAFEKAGIMRPGVPCFAALSEPALSVVREHAAQLGSPLLLLDEAFAATPACLDWQGTSVSFCQDGESHSLTTPLIGYHQVSNTALAAATARSLGIDVATVRCGLLETRWPGRLEVLTCDDRRVVLDGAHNPAAAQVVSDTLQTLLGQDKLTLVFGCNQDKVPSEMLRPLLPLTRQVIFTQATLSPKAYPPEQLQPLVPEAHLTHSGDEALAQALALTEPGDTILVAGSLYLIGEVRPLLLGEQGERFERWQ